MTAPTETGAPATPEPVTEPVPIVAPTEADRLLERSRRAAAVRAHQTNPDVVALSVERIRNWINLGMWVGMVIGMGFNTVNVQGWAAGALPKTDSMWWVSWALAPMAEIPLIAILIGEQNTGRNGVEHLDDWVRRARWTLLAGIFLMATWSTVTGILTTGGGWDKLLQHGFPVVVVLACAEALSGLRAGLNQAVRLAAERAAAEQAAQARREAEAAAAVAAAAAAAAAASKRERRERPTPNRRKPEPEPDRREQEPPANTGAGDPLRGRTAMEFGVEIACQMWREMPNTEGPTPIAIGTAMFADGVKVSKGYRSKIKTAAYKQLIAEGFPALEPAKKTGDDDADEPDTDEPDTDDPELTTAAEGGAR